MLSQRLNTTTDQLFIQPKCKIAFTSLSNGFGIASRRFRSILLREWFRLLYIRDIGDLDITRGRLLGVSSIDASGFIRELYFHEPLRITENHFNILPKVNTISYPLGDRRPSSDYTLPFFPSTITALELRDVATCSPINLQSYGILQYFNLERLKITCGDWGTWGALCDDPESQDSNPYKSKGFKPLVEDFAQSFSSLNHLRYLSLDLHLADTSLFPQEHTAVPQHLNQGAQPTVLGLPQIAVLMAMQQQQQLLLNAIQAQNAHLQGMQTTPIVPLIPPLPPAPPLPIQQPQGGIAAAAANTTVECTRNNLCPSCWEVRRPGAVAREIVLAKQLGKCLPHLEVVEYTIWFVVRGEGEQMRKVFLCRDHHTSQDAPTMRKKTMMTTKHGPFPTAAADTHTAEIDSEVIDDLVAADSFDDITCTTTQIPLALYPAILG